MKNTIVATRFILGVAAGATLLALSLGGCEATGKVTPDRPTPTPAPNGPGPHNHANDYKDGPYGGPGPHN